MDLGLTGKRALVLGASRGLGRAIAHCLAAEGADITVSARSADKLDLLVAELREQHGVDAAAAPCDMSDAAAVTAFAEQISSTIRPDILINNAGGPPPSKATGVSQEVWRRSVDSLLLGIIQVTEAALVAMRERKWGRILTIGSSGIQQPIPNLAVSNTIRSAVAGFSKSLANEVAGDGVTVNLILPGKIDTERVGELDSARAGREDKTVEQVRSEAKLAIPAGRYGTPQEFAEVATFLVSERAAYVTGQMTRVDGGMIKAL